MQLFTLVNTLLSVDTNSFKRQLHIQRYAVIPLAPNVGLIGMIKDSDTLHELVRDYRHSIKLLLNIEYRLMLQVSPTSHLRRTQLDASADGARLRESPITAENRSFRVRDGEHVGAGSVQNSVAQKHQLGALARTACLVHSIAGRHLHGRAYSWSRRSAPVQSHARAQNGQSRAR